MWGERWRWVDAGGRWRKGVAEWDILDYVHCLAAGLAGPKKRGWGRRGLGAQNSRSETLKHQRERHYPENKKTETSYTNTVNMHAHTHAHRTRHEIKMTTPCLLQHNFERRKQTKNQNKIFYIIYRWFLKLKQKRQSQVSELLICASCRSTLVIITQRDYPNSASTLRACITRRRVSAYACMKWMCLNVLTASTYPHSPVSSQINTNFFLFLLFFSLYKS